MLLGGCGSDESPPLTLDPATIDITPSNPKASSDTKRLLAYLGKLSTDQRPGAISGQLAGPADKTLDDSNIMSFHNNVQRLYDKTGKWPGVTGVDYAHDRWMSQSCLKLTRCSLIIGSKGA
ncbi:hypothetical protein JCM19233_426 [Vibrio astriarenae]|nr:hypothetical protein JCM19233_426 [Vibrio sp. C7]